MNKNELISKERHFLLQRTFEFINYGIVTFGLGLNAIDKLENLKKWVALVLCILFFGAVIMTIFGWMSYNKMRREEIKALTKDDYLSPSYWYVFSGGLIFGLLATFLFLYVGFFA